MQEQLVKMAAAAFGITPEATQLVIGEVMTFVQTANARIGALEIQSGQIHAMMLDLHMVEFPEKYPNTVAGIIAGNNDGELNDGRATANGGDTGRTTVVD